MVSSQDFLQGPKFQKKLVFIIIIIIIMIIIIIIYNNVLSGFSNEKKNHTVRNINFEHHQNIIRKFFLLISLINLLWCHLR